MELTPRTTEGGDEPVSVRRRRSGLAYGVLAVVLIALGVVVWQGLTSASLYFLNADEAVAQRDDLGDKRFRLQGTVLGGSVEQVDEELTFALAYGGARVDVLHRGDPPELFEPGIPVVLEGRWSEGADHFDSDRIMVKHSEQYEADHEDRLSDAESGATSTNQ